MCDQEAGLHTCICVLATEKFLVLHPHPEKQETRELMSFSRWLMKSKIPSSSSACYPLVIQAAFKQLYLNNPPKIKICSQSPSHKVFSRALPIVFWRPYTSPLAFVNWSPSAASSLPQLRESHVTPVSARDEPELQIFGQGCLCLFPSAGGGGESSQLCPSSLKTKG